MRSARVSRALCAAVLAVGIIGIANADIVLLSQSRTVTVQANAMTFIEIDPEVGPEPIFDSDGQSVSNTTAGAFASGLLTANAAISADGVAGSSSNAEQTTTVTLINPLTGMPDRYGGLSISGSGSASGGASAVGPADADTSPTESSIDLQFSLEDASGESVPYNWSVDLATGGNASSGVSASIRLFDMSMGSTVFEATVGEVLSGSGFLDSSALGQNYQFSVVAQANVFTFGGPVNGTADFMNLQFNLGDVSPVPEPSSFVLLSMGAVGLVGCRRRKRKRTA